MTDHSEFEEEMRQHRRDRNMSTLGWALTIAAGFLVDWNTAILVGMVFFSIYQINRPVKTKDRVAGGRIMMCAIIILFMSTILWFKNYGISKLEGQVERYCSKRPSDACNFVIEHFDSLHVSPFGSGEEYY